MKNAYKVITAEEASKPFTKEQNEQHIAAESAYRRGYRHGYSSAIDDSPQGAMNHLFHFFNTKLMKWSHFKDSKSKAGQVTVFPPESGEAQNGHK